VATRKYRHDDPSGNSIEWSAVFASAPPG